METITIEKSLYEQILNVVANARIQIKNDLEYRVNMMRTDLEKYKEDLKKEAEAIKAQLLTDEVDSILRNHVKSILVETFSVGA